MRKIVLCFCAAMGLVGASYAELTGRCPEVSQVKYNPIAQQFIAHDPNGAGVWTSISPIVVTPVQAINNTFYEAATDTSVGTQCVYKNPNVDNGYGFMMTNAVFSTAIHFGPNWMLSNGGYVCQSGN